MERSTADDGATGTHSRQHSARAESGANKRGETKLNAQHSTAQHTCIKSATHGQESDSGRVLRSTGKLSSASCQLAGGRLSIHRHLLCCCPSFAVVLSVDPTTPLDGCESLRVAVVRMTLAAARWIDREWPFVRCSLGRPSVSLCLVDPRSLRRGLSLWELLALGSCRVAFLHSAVRSSAAWSGCRNRERLEAGIVGFWMERSGGSGGGLYTSARSTGAGRVWSLRLTLARVSRPKPNARSRDWSVARPIAQCAPVLPTITIRFACCEANRVARSRRGERLS